MLGNNLARGGLLRLDIREPDHLPPLLSLPGDVFTELARRAREGGAAKISNPRFDRSVGKSGIDLMIEPLDDPLGRVFRRGNADPLACLEVRHEFTYCRSFWQQFGTGGAGHRQGAQTSGPDVFDG